jgi:hypothetical protein
MAFPVLKELMKYLVIYLLISINAMATTQEDLIERIRLRCYFLNNKIPLDERLGCMTDYINCTVLKSGEIDLGKADKECLKLKNKERQDDKAK